jgi:hypothetical protein
MAHPSGRVAQPLGMNFRVAAPSRFFEGAEGSIFRSVCGRINSRGRRGSIRVWDLSRRKAAPGPILRVIDQFSLQRIHVHVVELFHSLFQTPHVEVVKAALPETRQRIGAVCKGQFQLCGGCSLFVAQAPRDALFQNLNHGGRCCFTRFADEQMDVLRHDDITYQGEAVTVSHLAQNMDENISGANRAQKGQSSITSERDEMQMTASVVANEFVGHGTERTSNARPFKTRKGRPPGKAEPITQRRRIGVISSQGARSSIRKSAKGSATLYDVVGVVKRHV